MEEVDDKILKGQRVKKVRETLDITQKAFAEKIYVTHSQISAIELGKSKINEQNINLICTPNRLKEGYTVNEAWLRNGGDDKVMFKAPPPDNVRPKLYDKNNQELPIEEEELIGIYRKLEPPNKKAVMAAADALLDSQGGGEKGERRADTSKESV
jgi:transcriptional regulator with XRE-family HTH domain